MSFTLFKKILCLTLTLIMLFGVCLSLFSCNGNGDEDEYQNQNGEGGSGSEDNKDKSYLSKVIVPKFKEYPDRSTEKFSKIEYKRPDFTSINYAFSDAAYLIKKNAVPYEEQLAAVKALEDPYINALTMYQIANIHNSHDSADEYWSAEYNYISTSYPAFAKAIEDLFVEAARSAHASRFESDYFGEGLIEEYADGGMYTDEAVEYLADETRLENEYTALSPATVTISYAGQTDVAANILNFIKQKYGEISSQYSICYSIYYNEYARLSAEKLVNLLKVRKLIAGALGYSTYQEYAYEVMGHEYSATQMENFIDDTVDYIVPMFNQLYNELLTLYFAVTTSSAMSLDQLLNNSYYIFKDLDTELFDIYCYMLQYSLFDIELDADGRFDGAFTCYLEQYDAPFIFITADGKTTDYNTLFHEFGHFVDSYINYNSSASLDLQEVSSQALELIMTQKLGIYASTDDKNYLKYLKLSDAMQTMISQSFYAKFEAMAYSLSFDQINEQRLNDIILELAPKFGFNTNYVNSLSDIIIPHIMTYPFYVQSYATAIVPALEMYFIEAENTGEGLSIYKALIDRTESTDGFLDNLTRVGLTSPFEKGYLNELSKNLYEAIIGKPYDEQLPNNAA